jgi:hypothetical protein
VGRELYVVAPLDGAFNGDGMVDAADYVTWRKSLGQTGLLTFHGADGNGDGMVLADDLEVWRAHFGSLHFESILGSAALAAVPEPDLCVQFLMVAALASPVRLRAGTRQLPKYAG